MPRVLKNISTYLILVSLLTISQLANSQAIPDNLACELRPNPLGIDVQNPDFSYTLNINQPSTRGFRQTGYQILVASSPELLNKDNGDMWNSGKVLSDKMAYISYAGKKLKSNQKYWWKVRIWGQNGFVSSWSKISNWTMGILNLTDWNAKWISAAGAEKYALKYSSARQDFRLKRDIVEYRKAIKPGLNDPNYSSMLLRKEFDVTPNLKRAVIHICGLGQYELDINGKKVGDYLLSPGWTEYRKTLLYDTYDITTCLQSGKNAIGIILSNGMYNIQLDSIRYLKFLNSYGQLKAKAQLYLEYADGSFKTIGTDNSWEVSPGPVTYMNIYGGEDFDGRLVEIGWNKADFTGSKCWTKAIELPDSGAVLRGLSCAAPPIKAIEKIQPVKVTELKPNVWIYDLGQNASIMPEIKVKGPRGSYVRITPSELLYPDGSVDRRSATQDGVRPAWWQYTLTGEGEEYYFPKFFYQGGRYLQVELFPSEENKILAEVTELNGVVVHSSAEPIGTFSCSNELFNRIYSLVRWAQRSNMVSILTDCPQREKVGWLEQYHLNGPSLRYNFDLSTLFRKGMNDMSDEQYENGFVPNVAPELFYAGSNTLSDGPQNSNSFFAGDPIASGLHNSPEWGSSFIIVPWQQYIFSGDISLIKRYYRKMKKYLTFLDTWAKDNILYFGLGDWYDMGPKDPWGSQLTPIEFTATAIYFYDYKVMATMAALIGENEDAANFKKKAEIIRKSFNEKFYNEEKGIYSTGSNTTLAMPLALGIAESQNNAKIAKRLADDIGKNGNAFTSGDVGYRYLLKALAAEGYSDLIYEMNNQTEKPGYGYQLKMGATALTEKWNADGIYMGSQNHFMLGQINEWFFSELLGIAVNEDGIGAGFREFIINPMPVGDLKWVKGSYKSISGLIVVDWKREKDTFNMNVTIPANTLAKVYIPASNKIEINENNNQVSQTKEIKFLQMENGKAVYLIGSGEYKFVSKM